MKPCHCNSFSIVRRLGILPLIALLSLLFATGSTNVAAFSDRPPASGLHDDAGVLDDDGRERIESGIEDVEAAGAPAVVYLRLQDTSVDETIRDGRELMEAWEVESEPGARDGVVMFFNLEPDDPAHGAFAIVAGETHFDDGALPQSELDRIHDEMTGPLSDGELAEGIVLGLDLIAERLEAGPPEPSRLESWIAGVSEGPFNPLNAVALVSAIAIAFICWQAWSARPRVENVRETPTTTPPGTLHPAYAGALASGKVSDAQIEATVLELARRGALAIEPDHEASEKAQIRLLDTSLAETEFERRLLEQLWTRSADGVLDHKTLPRTRSDWGEVRSSLRRDLEARGWFDPRATRLRLPFYVTGIIGGLIAIAIFVATVIAQEPWPLIGAGVTGVVGLSALLLGSILPGTTHEGELQALPWRGYRTGLTNARDSQYGEVDLDRSFPYIVAMGLTAKFQRHLKKASEAGYIPDWLGSRDETVHFAGNWYIYWVALHTSMAPTDASTTSVGGAATGSGAAGGRF